MHSKSSAHVVPLALVGTQLPLAVSQYVPVAFMQSICMAHASQVPLLQYWLVQSCATMHPMPLAHCFVGAHLPPQSTSVSSPFCIMSLQFGGSTVPPSPPLPPSGEPPLGDPPALLPPTLATVGFVGILSRSILAASSQAPMDRPATSKATRCRVIDRSIPQDFPLG